MEKLVIAAALLAGGWDLALPNDTGNNQPGQICLANDSRFSQANFNQPLTTYAVGGWRNTGIAEELEFLAPQVNVSRHFTYDEWLNAEALLSEADDERAIGANFKQVEYKSTKTSAKTVNRGLTMTVDLDEVAEKDNWEQQYVNLLIARLQLNSFRRGVTLLAAAGVNQASTWDTTAGKDPDQDIVTALIAGNDVSGLGSNRIFYGHTAWAKRLLAHRAQNSAGGFASAGLNEQQLAQFLAVDQVMVSKQRYQSAAATKSQVVNNLVLMYNAQSGQMKEDPSNIKRFVTPTASGPVRVYSQQKGAKLWDITVEHYELIKITHTGGIRKQTIS